MPAAPGTDSAQVSFTRKKGKGPNRDKSVRRFFQGNALLAIVFLVAICGFLFKEAFFFFPDYHSSLQLYRKSGQEFVTLLEDQYKSQKESYALVDQAYNIERSSSSQAELSKMALYNDLRGDVLDEAEDAYDEWDESFDALDDAKDELEDAEPADLATAQQTLAEAEAVERQARADWRTVAAETIAEFDEKPEMEPPLSDEEWQEILTSLGELEPDSGQPKYLAELQSTIDERVGEFGVAREALRKSIKPLERLWLDLRDVASDSKAAGVAYKSAAERREALLQGAEVQKDPERAELMRQKADEVVTEAPDYDERIKPIYKAVPKTQDVSKKLIESIELAQEMLPQPETLKNDDARQRLERAAPLLEKSVQVIESRAEDLKNWRHDENYSWFRSAAGFFFGTKWVTNSSWQDFYGLLPLLSGSLLISIVALSLAVPFSVAAAIYTNQLAKPWESKFIKPTIEFIQAIPSVVLGLFGILVLGETLRELSTVPWLSWVPGFPMAERLNVLNAGILLALMAVPTVFTLAEDAINNVPRAFRDASFALGATKLQTVLRVIVPTAVSGIIAAILLGFGRVIGETMVVLLVAGNKIAIPDFSSGLGVLAEPVHTMTGLIAQETGEVNQGSLHWRALFMVGLVLFFISLVINYISQSLIRRFQLKN